MNATLLGEAERILQKHRPADFETTNDAWPECIEYVRAVEHEEAWRARYDSLDSFYAAHEARHPDIRYYTKARREIETADPLTSPGGTPAQRLERLRKADVS
jgi:hypothetical protein